MTVTKADLTKRPEQVSAMFDQVAANYDRTNDVLSVGNAVLWRVATTRAVGPRPGEKVLDLAAGTGTSSASLARSGAHVVAADFSPGMIDVGRRRQAAVPNIEFVVADGMDLPFADAEFDAVTISFGLRNIADPKVALAELFRVTKPGGRIVICEFSQPVKPLRQAYFWYLRRVMPALAKAVSSNDAAYDYLFESIASWPDQKTLAGWLRETGFRSVRHRDLSAGIVALHKGVKPESPEK
ncbi:class I SAM-dependent methyltransferase [Herbiconiux sp. CPCC 203407]|uniref:Demethylmenaquinone methyltransferase n=2 Tax=Herbiconiux oxytropis TaxID=2970915 RepID=A0AA41XEA2_9MICO|nr:class I SAM-dependent methyltransferase [Herbiconiux oxytropis]MCS5723812.1 class I SAM-dependent methyltransferase [Herbiconiux oxytropis]MCS5726594.1 class I SAM-dependent methyltransferase [Herbiconiux oxytropis]